MPLTKKKEKTQVKKNPSILNSKLYLKAKQKYQNVKHSAYKSGLIVQEYKRLGGRYSKPSNKHGLTRWFKEKWRNQRGEVGYKHKSDIYRPTKRVSRKTPMTHHELTKKEINRARREKVKKGRVKRFKLNK
jgi:hypothetical protein